MAIKHVVIKPFRHAGVASQDKVFRSGGVIVEGAPVVFNNGVASGSNGKVFEATDAAGGILQSQTSLTGQSPILGIALNATTAVDQDVLVALALPGRRFVGSLTDLVDAIGSAVGDAGAHALAQADVGKYTILHKDKTTLKWVLAGGAGAITIPTMAAQKFVSTVANAAFGTGSVLVYPQVFIDALVDRIGATTNDTITFGGSGGSGQNAFPPPNTTWQAEPSVSDFGTARVSFEFVIEATYLG